MYAAQGILKIDTARAEKSPFRMETKLVMSVRPGNDSYSVFVFNLQISISYKDLSVISKPRSIISKESRNCFSLIIKGGLVNRTFQ
jgi:hypothetical protein